MSLATAKTHLRVLHSDDDSQISDLIAAGIDEFEQTTGRAFSEQSCELRLSEFPAYAIAIPRPPLVAVDSITYLDSSGTRQTLSDSAYSVDASHSPALIVPAVNASWPTALNQPGSILITFSAGIIASCSPRILNALKLWLDLQYHELDDMLAKRLQSRIDSILSQRSLRHPGLEGLTVCD